MKYTGVPWIRRSLHFSTYVHKQIRCLNWHWWVNQSGVSCLLTSFVFLPSFGERRVIKKRMDPEYQADWTLSATSLRISSGWITVATKNMYDAWSVQPFRYITHCVWCWLARLKSQAPSVQELYRTLLFILFCYWLLQSYDHMNLCTRKTRPWALPCANNQDTSLPQEALT